MVIVDMSSNDVKINEIVRGDESSWCGPLGNGPGISTAAK